VAARNGVSYLKDCHHNVPWATTRRGNRRPFEGLHFFSAFKRKPQKQTMKTHNNLSILIALTGALIVEAEFQIVAAVGLPSKKE
jgi:hypothetical protein